LKNELSEKEIEDWANLVECREDIELDDVLDVISILANPLLKGVLTQDRAKKLIRKCGGE
jgi:hypothetical protein